MTLTQFATSRFVDVLPTISGARLLGDIADFATYGGRPDGGVDRVAGSAADAAGRTWLMERVRQADLEPVTDAVGNVFGHVPGTTQHVVLSGSHTDTVPAGGRLDGAYGVLAALEVLRTLHEYRHPAARLFQMVGFWDEEGARPDAEGGLTGSTAYCAGDQLQTFDAFLELHVEQGPRLEAAGVELAVVDGIVGVDRYAVTMQGVTNHAGTTPMAVRRDAGQALVHLCSRVRERINAVDSTMVVNVGFLTLDPGVPNVIPGRARSVVEVRGGSQKMLDGARAAIYDLAEVAARAEGCSAHVEQLSHKPPAHFDPALCELLERVCRLTGGPTERLLSFAGHDASVLSRHVPTAMLFVPSTGGISHSPDEHTSDRALVGGCQALLDAVLEVTRDYWEATT